MKKRMQWKRAFTVGAPTAIVLLAVVIAGSMRVGGTGAEVGEAVLSSLAFALAAGCMAGRRLHVWLTSTVAGIAIGIASVAPIFFWWPVEAAGHYSLGLLTIAFFAALGISIGAFFEFIFYLHHLSHGRHPKQYPPDVAERRTDDSLSA